MQQKKVNNLLQIRNIIIVTRHMQECILAITFIIHSVSLLINVQVLYNNGDKYKLKFLMTRSLLTTSFEVVSPLQRVCLKLVDFLCHFMEPWISMTNCQDFLIFSSRSMLILNRICKGRFIESIRGIDSILQDYSEFIHEHNSTVLEIFVFFKISFIKNFNIPITINTKCMTFTFQLMSGVMN